jgi:hypothetical protein
MVVFLAVLGWTIAIVGLYLRKELIYRLFYSIWLLEFSIILLGLLTGFKLYILYISLFLTSSLILLFSRSLSNKASHWQKILMPMINLLLIVLLLSNYFHWPFAFEQKWLLYALLLFSILFLHKNKLYKKEWYYLTIITCLINTF